MSTCTHAVPRVTSAAVAIPASSSPSLLLLLLLLLLLFVLGFLAVLEVNVSSLYLRLSTLEVAETLAIDRNNKFQKHAIVASNTDGNVNKVIIIIIVFFPI